MSSPINFSNSWTRLSYQKHYTWKNHEAQSLGNKMLKDVLKKKLDKKKTIKIIRVKTIRKNKSNGNNKFSISELNSKE